MAEFMRMKFEEMEDLATEDGKMGVQTSDAAAEVSKVFKPVTDGGGLQKNVKVAVDGMQKISDLIGGINKIVKQHTSDMLEYENTLAKKADDIEIPKDFLAENSLKVNEYNYSLVQKLDGKAVTEGKAQGEAKDIDESVVAAEGLVDITKQDTQEQKLDESTVIGKSVLGNIVKDETKAQELDGTSSVQAKSLGDVNNGNNQVEQKIDESTVIGRSVLGNINAESGAVAAAAVSDYNSSVEQEKERKEKEEQMKAEEELVRPDFDELIPSDK